MNRPLPLGTRYFALKTQAVRIEQPAPPSTKGAEPHTTRPAPATRFSVLKNHLLPLLAYSLLTILLTWPVPIRLATELPGGGDAWQNIWNLWWVKEALLNLHTNPYHTDLLFYPNGVNLYFHTLALSDGIVAIPLQLLGLNLIATYNLILLSSFVLAGYGAYLLCRYLTGSRWASFVGGLVFAFSPYHFAHMFGHMNLVSLQWIPFYVLVLLKTLDAGRPAIVRKLIERRRTDGDSSRPGGHLAHRTANGDPILERADLRTAQKAPQSTSTNWRALLLAVGAGALLALNAYTDWIYAMFMALLTALVVTWKVLLPSERRAMLAAGVGWLAWCTRVAVAGLAFLVLTAPIFFPTLAEAGKGYAQQPAEETLFYSSDLVSAFIPNELHPLWGPSVKARVEAMPPYLPLKNPSERVVFLGYSVLTLAAIAVWRLRKNRGVLFWGFTALLMWILSLGPVLQVMGKSQFTLFKVSVPLPYLVLFKLPLFSIMRTPARLTVLAMLALAVLVSFALANLLPALSRPRSDTASAPWVTQLGIALAIPILILFEFLSIPFPTVPPGWNVPIYAKIAQEPGNFALLELPIRPFGDYMAYQTIHGKPIIGGYLARQPPYPLEEQNATIKYLLDTTPSSDPLQAEVKGGKGVQSLRDLNVKYVIIRWWAFTPEQKAEMQAKLNNLLARPPDFTYTADEVDVWQLIP